MSVFEKIVELLETSGVDYKIVEHEPVYTSEEAARIRDSDISMGAKALVLFADKKPILVVVPGDKKLSFSKFKKLTKIKDLRFATHEEVEKLTTLKVGSIPPFGSVMNLDRYFDESFTVKDKVAFNAGSHTKSIIMLSKDLLAIEKPVILSIT